MPLISCPECQRDVSDQARQCPQCGFPVAAHIKKLKDEEAARLLLEEQEREREWKVRENTIIGVVVIVIVFFVIAGIASSNTPPAVGTTLYSLDKQTTGITANQAATFKVHGKAKIAFNCQAAASGATVQMNLNYQDYDSSTVVWKHTLTCPASGSDTVSLADGSYYFTIVVSGKSIWSVAVVQQ